MHGRRNGLGICISPYAELGTFVAQPNQVVKTVAPLYTMIQTLLFFFKKKQNDPDSRVQQGVILVYGFHPQEKEKKSASFVNASTDLIA